MTPTQVAALAAVFQSAELVHRAASEGRFDHDDVHPLLEAVFEPSGKEVDLLYGRDGALKLGYQILNDFLNNQSKVPHYIVQYVLGMIIVQKKLSKSQPLTTALDQALDISSRQYERMGLGHDSVISTLSDTYSESASRLKYRIQVTGDPAWLSQPQVAARVRTLLLAGVRAVTRWRQLGGSRFDFVLRRSKMKAIIEQYATKSS